MAHHSLEYFIDSDRKNLEDIFKGKELYYLCGHEHKSCISKNFTNHIWTIMTGTLKQVEQEIPSFTIGELTPSQTLLSIDIYHYDGRGFMHKSLFENEIKFVLQDNGQQDQNTTIVQLPLRYSYASKKEHYQEAMQTLITLKSRLHIMNPTMKFIIQNDSLSLNAAIMIGCALHTRKGIQITCREKYAEFDNGVDSKPIPFEIEDEGQLAMLDVHKQLNMCIYIQAKEWTSGKSTFDNYIKEMDNTYYLTFVHKDKYNEKTNLLESAKSIVDKILDVTEIIKSKGHQQISYHIFINSIWDLALFLGTVLPQYYQYQLYDCAEDTYHQSFIVSPRDFDPIV